MLLVRIVLVHLALAAIQLQAHGVAVSDDTALSPALKEMWSRLDPEEVDMCEEYLWDTMPKADQGTTVTRHQLRVNSILALTARYAQSWTRQVPWQVFLNDVLPYASLDEPRDEWRSLFAPRFAPLVANATSLTAAAQALNRDIWSIWGIVFKANETPDIMSPSQVIAAGYASCTGLSIFLVNACRSVGIPARVAGTPSWVKRSWAASVQHARTPYTTSISNARSRVDNGRLWADTIYNNHNWVEIWDDSQWSFVGAAEYNPLGVNRTWFFPEPVKHQIPGGGLHAVYAASWTSQPQCGSTTFPLVWNMDYKLPGCDVTQSYIDAAVPS